MQTHRGFMLRLKLRQHSRSLQARALISSRALISAGAIIVALSSCAAMEPTVPAEPGVAFSLPIGKTAAINGSGTRLTFRLVREDSRCPTDVTCVWEGDAKIEVVISRSGSSDDIKVLSLRTPSNEATSGDLQIRFVGLTPVPRQADGNAPRAYVAQLVVNRI